MHSTDIFVRGWPDQAPDTFCGWGSIEQHTRLGRTKVVEPHKAYHVKPLKDASYGDLAWISIIDLPTGPNYNNTGML